MSASLRFLFLALLASLVSTAPARAGDASPPPVAELSVRDAIALGLGEGVTEFLPISSTGHLILVNQMLGLESDQQLTDKAGRPLWHKPPSEKHPGGVPLTLKLAANTYTVIIQVGAISAVVMLYWQQLFLMLGGLFGRSSAGLRRLRNVLLAFFPVAIVGLLFAELVDRYLFSPLGVAAAAAVGAFVILWAERWRESNAGIGRTKGDPADLTPRKSLGVGLIQCLALCPGASRSMLTIVGGYLAGLGPAKAAEFSFLVGLPTLGGAACYKALQSGPAMIEVFGWSSVLLGMAVAAVSAFLSVKFLVHLITRYGLTFFAYYRLALAVVLVVVYLF